jgi:hypothetical protein
MADIKVQKVEKAEDRALPVFQQVDEILGRIQRRAFELFEGRGFADGHDLEDWVCGTATSRSRHGWSTRSARRCCSAR